jgi:hypothetical protein
VSRLPPLGFLPVPLGGPCLLEELKRLGELMLINEVLLPTFVTLQLHPTTLHQTLVLLIKKLLTSSNCLNLKRLITKYHYKFDHSKILTAHQKLHKWD